eukprot:5335733-Pyramimonas_sp.AAC.1
MYRACAIASSACSTPTAQMGSRGGPDGVQRGSRAERATFCTAFGKLLGSHSGTPSRPPLDPL